MAKRIYLGGVSGHPGSYGIVFPDFLGCVSVGESLTEVAAMGREALQSHVNGMVEDGDTIPEPSPVDFVRLDAEFADPEDLDDVEPWVAVIAIEVEVPTFPLTVPVPLDTSLVQAVDRAVPDRRQFIMDATRRELERLKKSA
ncbi:MAG: type II toxin-antitoxin system HicB family antitoxin [Sphingomonadaceae bacterium]|nr:type II toxin-antitoxin system HicB family antitoxin [Sphingomonadaceae bacterium]